MNNPVLPMLDGLLGLSQTFSDNASQKSWAEIEDLEKEHGAPGTIARQMLSAGTSLSTSSGAVETLLRAPVTLDGKNDWQEVFAPEGEGADFAEVSRWSAVSMEDLPEAVAAPEVRSPSYGQPMSGDGKAAVSSQTPPVSGPNWQSSTEFALSSAPVDVQAEQAVAAAADGVEHGLATSGPVVAAQTLHSAIRSLSPTQVAVLLDNAAPVIARLVEQSLHGDERGSVTEEKPRDARTALVLAHVAAAIDKDPRPASAIRVLQDLGAVVLGAPGQNDNRIFAGLARTIGVGAGIRLVLALANEIAHRDENPSRARALVLLMLSAFGALGERIDTAYSTVLQQAGPLCLAWLGWREMGEERALERLIATLEQQPDMLDDMAPKLEHFEQTGLEAFRAVRDLAAFTIDPKLDDVRAHFLGSPSVFASIAGSRSALRDVYNTAAAKCQAGEDVTLDMVRLTLTEIGFDAPKAAFLAELADLDSNALMLGANWTALESFGRMEVQGRTFQRLLAFLNGQFVVASRPDIIGFDDEDMQA